MHIYTHACTRTHAHTQHTHTQMQTHTYTHMIHSYVPNNQCVRSIYSSCTIGSANSQCCPIWKLKNTTDYAGTISMYVNTKYSSVVFTHSFFYYRFSSIHSKSATSNCYKTYAAGTVSFHCCQNAPNWTNPFITSYALCCTGLMPWTRII